MRLLPYGERAVLAEVDEPRLVPALRAAVAGTPGVIDAVAGARTVLVVYDPTAIGVAEVRHALERAEVSATARATSSEVVVLRVVYDGADLPEVAEQAGLHPDQVVALHSEVEYVVRFCGFSPGFAYLDGLDTRLQVPRRAEPRTRVPAGSVAVAGEFAGVYPRPSPGGWRLLGRTDTALWDATRDPPALLAPGTRVRFEPT